MNHDAVMVEQQHIRNAISRLKKGLLKDRDHPLRTIEILLQAQPKVPTMLLPEVSQ